MKNLSYILPVIEYKKEYLERCLNSLSFNHDEELVIIGPSEVLNNIKDNFTSFTDKTLFIDNETNIDFCSQVNLGVSKCNRDFFMIVEFDDMIYPTWTKHVEEHLLHKHDVSLFLPLIEMVDDKDEGRRALCNEISWSTAFAEELGYIDSECLESYYDFHITGGVFKKSDFVKVGGLKTSLKNASAYELLLRYAHNGLTIFTIPKIGYRHTFGREGSYMMTVESNITQEEGKWLIKTAKEEKFFTEDRKKVFNND